MRKASPTFPLYVCVSSQVLNPFQGGPWQLEDNATRGGHSIKQTKKSPGTGVVEASR